MLLLLGNFVKFYCQLHNYTEWHIIINTNNFYKESCTNTILPQISNDHSFLVPQRHINHHSGNHQNFTAIFASALPQTVWWGKLWNGELVHICMSLWSHSSASVWVFMTGTNTETIKIKWWRNCFNSFSSMTVITYVNVLLGISMYNLAFA